MKVWKAWLGVSSSIQSPTPPNYSPALNNYACDIKYSRLSTHCSFQGINSEEEMAEEKTSSFCIICYTQIPYGHTPCCTTTNLYPTYSGPKTTQNSNCYTGTSKAPSTPRDASFHPPEWTPEEVAHVLIAFMNGFL
jgi:hypothetical protein